MFIFSSLSQILNFALMCQCLFQKKFKSKQNICIEKIANRVTNSALLIYVRRASACCPLTRLQTGCLQIINEIVGQTRLAKLNEANAVSFVIVKHVLENFDNFWQVK